MTRFLSTSKYSKTTTNSMRLKPVSPMDLRLKKWVGFVSSSEYSFFSGGARPTKRSY